MKFIIKEDNNQEPRVRLTLEKDGDRVLLKANGHSIMGFKNGKFCKYSNAQDKVEGIMFDEQNPAFIKEVSCYWIQ
jgi:hypothetical protein